MFVNISKVFTSITALADTASVVLSKRQAGLVSCSILLKGDTPMDPTNEPALVSEFNYGTGSGGLVQPPSRGQNSVARFLHEKLRRHQRIVVDQTK